VSEPHRIAMWSGPRNISTAMMRAFENRADCTVVDEPFYAHYLKVTGIEHPGRDEVIAAQTTEWQDVVEGLVGPVPGGRRIFYQKHMAHHMTGEIGHGWFGDVTHAFLIRSPEEMVASYALKREAVTPEDLGLDLQVSLYKEVEAMTGKAPPVINARDVLGDPEGVLSKLCDALGLEFDKAMLHWPKGRRESDGVWAKYWYHAVEASTGFKPYEVKEIALPSPLKDVAQHCRAPYDWLNDKRLRA